MNTNDELVPLPVDIARNPLRALLNADPDPAARATARYSIRITTELDVALDPNALGLIANPAADRIVDPTDPEDPDTLNR